MSDLLIRNVSAATIAALKARARARGRSVQIEALEILERGVATGGGATFAQWVETLRTSPAGAPDASGPATHEDA